MVIRECFVNVTDPIGGQCHAFRVFYTRGRRRRTNPVIRASINIDWPGEALVFNAGRHLDRPYVGALSARLANLALRRYAASTLSIGAHRFAIPAFSQTRLVGEGIAKFFYPREVRWRPWLYAISLTRI